MIKVGIDIGNSKISSIVCNINNDGSKKVLSFVNKPTSYVNKSLVTNLVSIKDEINEIIKEAAKESQTEINSINLNLPAVESLSLFSDSEINISGEMISDLHLKTAVNKSDILELIENFDIIQNLIISYDLDNKSFANCPTGIIWKYIKSKFLQICCKKEFYKYPVKFI